MSLGKVSRRSLAPCTHRQAAEVAGGHTARSTRSKRGRSCKITSIGGDFGRGGWGTSLIQCCGHRRHARRHSSIIRHRRIGTTPTQLLSTCAGTALIDSFVVPAQRPLACRNLCRHKQERSFCRHTVPAHNIVRWNDGAGLLLFFLPSRVPWVQ